MTKTKLALGLIIAFGSWGGQSAEAQIQSPPPPPRPIPTPVVSPNPKLSIILAKNLERQQTPVSRENRQQAYAKLLEGQRHFWAGRLPFSPVTVASARLAKQAFQKAVELDPSLSEGYTALAELAVNTQPVDMDEAIALANIAVKINPGNFGAQRILARVYTIKSRLRTDSFDAVYAQKAISAWKEIARLDPRSAESWAFLSEFYDKTNKPKERIEALQNWLSAAAPIDARFYRAVMGAQESLTPESASLKLGSALVKANRAGEAVEILSRAIADDPENLQAVDLLKQAVDNGTGNASPATLEALQQAAYANPGNLAIVELLARVQSRTGKTDDAAKSLKSSIEKLIDSDKSSAASLQISLGDIYVEANRDDEAVAVYEAALKTQGIDKDELATDDQREFAMQVFGKIIQTYKSAGRLSDAQAAIERTRILLGKDDLFADRQLISLLRESGRSSEALQSVRLLRSRIKDDYGLLRLEALILTEMGKVDDGVELIKPLIGKGKTLSAPSLAYDDFNNYIYISTLFNQARRGKEAIASAQQAYVAAESDEKKQIAHLTLANARQTSGEYQAAEEILRNLLKQSPSNPIALNNLGYFLLERDQKIEEAIVLIRQAVEIDPTNASYLDSLGWAYYKIGKLGEAELYLKEAINNDSSSATLYEHLGDVYHKQGRTELAKTSWRKAVNLATTAEANNRIKDKLAKQAVK